jgi:hypothetical protein
MKKWEGPQLTEKWIGIDTPLPYLNESWNIAVRLLDKGRKLYHSGKGLGAFPDNPKGYPGAWLPVSLGRRAPLVYPWDERDIRHNVLMISYLWAEEEGLMEEFEKNMWIDQILEKGDFITHDGNKNSPYIVHYSMYACAGADIPMYFGVNSERQKHILKNVSNFIKRTFEFFDPENSGLLNIGVGPDWYDRGFWGTHLGEPNHFPSNFDGTSKNIISSMAFAVLTKRYRELAHEINALEYDYFQQVYQHLNNAIEILAWNELTGYYYIQRDNNSARWFHSINGLNEDSRETDIVPYYVANACENHERIKSVGRVINRAIIHDYVFPMPTRYPTYAWYSPSNPNGIDQGEDCGQLGGSWDTPYYHCVQLLNLLGLQKAIQRAVFRRAEVIYRDNDCLESYRLDGTVDHTYFYNRDEYIVSATAHIASIIEGLFGITPAKTGYDEVNIHPNLPLYRRHRHTTHASDWTNRDNKLNIYLGNGGRFELVIHYDEDAEELRLKTNKLNITGHIRLPIDLGSRFHSAMWGDCPVKVQIIKGMDSDFIYLDHKLDGEELKIKLNPHPDKGKGTTPHIIPKNTLK